MKTRTFLLALLSLLISAVSSAATSSGLVPTQCTIGDRLVFGPISSVGFIFDVGVSVTPEAKAYLKNGDVVVNTRNVTSVGNTTEIEGVEASTNSDRVYTLQGVRLQQPPKQGVYIQNGKKFVAK